MAHASELRRQIEASDTQELDAFLDWLWDDESDLPTLLAVEERYGVRF